MSEVGEGQAGPSALHRKIGFCKAPAECLGCQEIAAALRASEAALRLSKSRVSELEAGLDRTEDARNTAEAALADALVDVESKQVGLNLYEERLQKSEAALATMTKERDRWRLACNNPAAEARIRELEASRAEATKAGTRLREAESLMEQHVEPALRDIGYTTMAGWLRDFLAIRAPQPPELETEHGNYRDKCGCEGCPTMVPACWAAGMCRPCATEDCQHEVDEPAPSSPPPPSEEPTELQQRYAAMGKAPWFKAAHEGKSLADEPCGCVNCVGPAVPSPSPTREEPRE